MTFTEHMRAAFGPKWVLAQRLTAGLCAKGYTRAVTRHEYRQEQLTWARARERDNPEISAAVRVQRDHVAREAAEILARYTSPNG